MLKKTIEFEDLDGNPVSEDFYFNLSKAELAEMELTHEGGFQAHLQKLIDSRNGEQIVSTFKEIIRKSVGKRSDDGRRFIKSQEIWEDFYYSEAYSTFFMELVTDANAGAAFINAIMPKDLVDKVSKQVKEVQLPDEQNTDGRPQWLRENREPTKEELANMSKDELQTAFMWRNQNNKQEQHRGVLSEGARE